MPQISLHDAAHQGHYEQLKQLLAQNPELVNRPEQLHNGKLVYALEKALCNRHYECAILLLEYRADPSIQYSFKDNRATPLHCAAEKGILAEILLLLYFGAGTTCKTDTGLTPIDSANLSPSRQLNRITSDELNNLIKEMSDLQILQKECRAMAEESVSGHAQKKYAIEIGNNFMRMGNKITISKYGEKYYLPIAQFFYKKAITYYTLAADFYNKELNPADEQSKAKYLEIIKLLVDLHHRTQNFAMRDYYDKLILTIAPEHHIINDSGSQWKQKTASTDEKADIQYSHFWSKPFKLIAQRLQPNASKTHPNARLTQ